jgi:hypothetical protein
VVKELLKTRRRAEDVAGYEGMGLAITELRDKHRMTQADLAASAELAPSSLRQIERGNVDAHWGTNPQAGFGLGDSCGCFDRDGRGAGSKDWARSASSNAEREPAGSGEKRKGPRVTMRKAAVTSRDAHAEMRSAICVYLIGECREGATVGELARLRLGGQLPSDEVDPVSEAVSQLVHEGQVKLEGEKVVPN